MSGFFEDPKDENQEETENAFAEVDERLNDIKATLKKTQDDATVVEGALRNENKQLRTDIEEARELEKDLIPAATEEAISKREAQAKLKDELDDLGNKYSDVDQVEVLARMKRKGLTPEEAVRDLKGLTQVANTGDELKEQLGKYNFGHKKETTPGTV